MITTLYSIFLSLDGLVYNIIDWIYDIFVAIATIDVFSTEQETINKIVTNVYVILGVVMLFALAYSLLRAVINPESFSKGDTSFAKLVQNIVVSIVIIAILPTCFNFAYKFQTSILENDTIPNLLFGDSIDNPFTLEDTADNPNPSPGRTLAYSIFSSFLYVDFDVCASDLGTSVESLTAEQVKSCSEDIMIGATGGAKYVPFVNTAISWLTNLFGDSSTSSFYYYDSMVKYGKYDFGVYSNFSASVLSGNLSYTWFFSTIVGIYVAYVLLNFVFDVALRFIKMLFLEIIAPIPVICRIIPGGKMKDVFSTWLKKVISVYLEVFIRVFTIVIGLYLILLVNDMDLVFGTTLQGLGFFQRVFARVVIIMGIVTFIRQAPKLICDLFHIDSGGMKLGLAEKIAAGGGFVAASAARSAGSMFLKNGVRAVKNFRGTKGEDIRTRLGAAVTGVGSTLAGTVSGVVRGGYNARSAKNIKDARNSSNAAVSTIVERQDKRENYRADHQGANFVDTMVNVGKGHINDTKNKFKDYIGIGDDLSALQGEQAVYQEGLGFKKKLFDLVADNERVLAYQGLKKTAQEKDINGYVSDIEKQISALGYTKKDSHGYFKTNVATGDVEYYKDSEGKIIKDLTSIAIERKTADIKKYDDAIKLASLNAISEKIDKGDGRFTAILEESKVWKSQNAAIPDVFNLHELTNLNAGQVKAINDALASNDKAIIKRVLDAFEGDKDAMSALGIDSLAIMKNDKELKTANGNVQVKISQKIQEKKKDSK